MSPLSVLDIPELLLLICNSADDSTRACLARTCSILFQTVSPILWENITGAHRIFVLLPGSIIDPTKPADPLGPPPNTYDPAHVDVVRFNVYAPLVKSLHVYEVSNATQRTATTYNWAFLESFARQQPLLPNLRHLVINQRRGASTQEKWIGILATRGLQAVCSPLIIDPRILPYPSIINLSMAATAMATLADRASDIKTLEIYPLSTTSNLEAAEPKSSSTSQPSPYRVFYNSLGHLTALRRLAMSALLFEPSVLAMVGNLPHLESIYVHMVSRSAPNFTKEALPTNSFRSLNHLELTHFQQAQLEVIFSWGPFVERLRSLKVCTSDARYMTEEWARGVFVPRLRNCSPELTEFLCENSTRNYVFSAPFKIGLDSLK
ncbi:hypothetical protein BDV93DRAFT_548027 [Ceratobasidium sp. AG-I]|nr:hypothetical protein BDV93DRAFT_548027 [Ceratobasidium sp. AG-I]